MVEKIGWARSVEWVAKKDMDHVRVAGLELGPMFQLVLEPDVELGPGAAPDAVRARHEVLALELGGVR